MAELRALGMHAGYGKQLERRLGVIVNRGKALWPQAADLRLGGLACVRADCTPRSPGTPLLSLNHFSLEHREPRYQLVVELANPYLSTTERRELIRQKARIQHEVPFLGPRRYSVGCIQKWLSLYRKHGRAGLAPRTSGAADVGRQ